MENRFIRKLRNLGDLDADDIAALTVATANPRTVEAKRDLIRDGDAPGPVFVMLEGWACRYKVLPNGARQVLAFLMPGDSCDLNAGLSAQMDHSIQTITASVVATINRPMMDGIFDRHRAIAKALYLAQHIDEGTMRAWITSMGRRTSMERVAHLMCELYIRGKLIGLSHEQSVELPLSQLLLADALGMTPVHLNRVLRKLRAQDAVTLLRGRLVIDDPAKLVTIAGFDENYLHRRLKNAA